MVIYYLHTIGSSRQQAAASGERRIVESMMMMDDENGGNKSAIEIDSLIWREEIGNRNRLVNNLAGRNRQ